MIIRGCNWLTVSKIKKTAGKFGFVGVLWLEGKTLKRSYTSLQFSYMLVMDINSICKTQLTDTYEERIQNDVIDLRILGDIGSVCIYRFPFILFIIVS